MNDYEQQFSNAYKCIKRSPNTIHKVFELDGENITGENLLKLHNEYGLDIKSIVFLAEVSYLIIKKEVIDEFINLLIHQQKLLKNSKQC